MTDATFTRTDRPTLASRFADFRQGVSQARARRAEYNRVHAELSYMSDRDLADIGISRVSIRDIAREAAGLK